MKWFSLATSNDGQHANIWINSQIGIDWWTGDGTTAQSFIDEVSALGDVATIMVHINSPGGDVADGITIANYLRGHKATVTTRVEGIAASIAATIASAGDRVEMALGSLMMIHDPWTIALGNSTEMRKLADDLDTIRDGIMAIFIARVGEAKREEIKQLMAAETWLTGEDAIALGLVDEVESSIRAAASIGDYSRAFAAAARDAQHRVEHTKPSEDEHPEGKPLALIARALHIDADRLEENAQPALDAISTLRAAPTVDSLQANYPQLVASIEAAARDSVDVSASRAEGVKNEQDRIRHILNTCRTANQPQLVDRLIDNGSEEKAVSDYVYDVANAASNASHINGNHSPEGGQHRAGIDHTKIYSRINRRPGAH